MAQSSGDNGGTKGGRGEQRSTHHAKEETEGHFGNCGRCSIEHGSTRIGGGQCSGQTQAETLQILINDPVSGEEISYKAKKK